MMFCVHKVLCACAVLVLCSASVRGEEPLLPAKSVWQGGYLARVEALALLQTLNADTD